jgi:hypothetical protein
LLRLEVERVRIGIGGGALFEPLLLVRRQAGAEGARDLHRDIALDGQQIRQLAIVLIGPERLLRRGVDQLRADADAAPFDADAAVHELRDTEIARRPRRIPCSDGVERVAAEQPQRRHLRELPADLFGHPRREISLRRIG